MSTNKKTANLKRKLDDDAAVAALPAKKQKRAEEIVLYMNAHAESIETEKTCAVLCMNAHDLVVEDPIPSDDSRVNILDMQMRSCFATQFVYKDATMKTLLFGWLDNSGIAPENLMLWNFTQRENDTARPNRQIAIDWKETPNAEDDEKYTADQIRRHMIPTDARKLRSVSSLYQRIGDLRQKKRAFMLLDRTRVADFPVPANSIEKSQFLIALKYFDIVHQRLYFVDWLLCHHSMCVQDIATYIDETLVPSTRSRRSYFRELYALSQDIDAFGERHSHAHAFTKYAFFEEEKTSQTTSNAKSFENEKNSKVNLLEYDTCLTKENYMNGDILVFQLNSKHPYFKHRDETDPIVEFPEPVSLAWRLQAYQHVFEAQGEFWYPLLPKFIRSRLNLIRVKLAVRENAGWKSTWAPALLLQHQTRNDGVAIDKAERRRITRKTHTFRVEKDCTFGMLRTKLGAYYGIRATHIEIWTPSVTSYESDKLWDYGSTARGAWQETLRSLVERRLEYRQELPLKFEIQTYNVKELDQMTELDHVRQSAPRAARFGERIRSLAMFNVKFLPPGFGGSGGTEVYDMTVAYPQNFVARQLIRWLFSEIKANPIFGYTFCGPLLRYIQQEQEEQQGSGAAATDDVSWLDAIPTHRFLVCFIEAGKLEVPDTFHMDDKYVMPQHFVQTKYTDFRLQMLAADDPKVLRYEMKQQQQQQPPKGMELLIMEVNGTIAITAADGDEKSMANAEAEAEIPTKALWCHFVKQQDTLLSKACVRTVLHKGESLKQLILAQLLQYLKVSLTQSAAADTATNKATATSQATATPTSESDALFDAICERYKFRLYASNLPKKSQVLSLGLLQATDIFEQLQATESFFLAVTLPKPKQKMNILESFAVVPLVESDANACHKQLYNSEIKSPNEALIKERDELKRLHHEQSTARKKLEQELKQTLQQLSAEKTEWQKLGDKRVEYLQTKHDKEKGNLQSSLDALRPELERQRQSSNDTIKTLQQQIALIKESSARKKLEEELKQTQRHNALVSERDTRKREILQLQTTHAKRVELLQTKHDKEKGNLQTSLDALRPELERQRQSSKTLQQEIKDLLPLKAYADDQDFAAFDQQALIAMEKKFEEKLKNIKEAKQNLSICIVCEESARNQVFVPCGHVCICGGCKKHYESATAKCPMCREIVSHVVRMFHS